jgi:hypothetical protein
MGPSLLIATCLVLAIRTAKWPSLWHETTSNRELDTEIEYAAHLAGRVLSALSTKNPAIFPSVKIHWYKPNDEDVPK